MPLASINLAASTNWSETNTLITGFNATTQSDAMQFALQGINLSTWNQAYVDSIIIAASGHFDIDLTNVSNFVCESFAFTKVLAIMALPTGATIEVGPQGVTHALQWFWDDANAYTTVTNGGMMMWSEGAPGVGTTVDSTHKIIRLLNTSGSASATVKIVVLGGTA